MQGRIYTFLRIRSKASPLLSRKINSPCVPRTPHPSTLNTTFWLQFVTTKPPPLTTWGLVLTTSTTSEASQYNLLMIAVEAWLLAFTTAIFVFETYIPIWSVIISLYVIITRRCKYVACFHKWKCPIYTKLLKKEMSGYNIFPKFGKLLTLMRRESRVYVAHSTFTRC